MSYLGIRSRFPKRLDDHKNRCVLFDPLISGAVMERNNIPGIYNYCDRWCERCKFTSRCAVYEREGCGINHRDLARQGDLISSKHHNVRITQCSLLKSTKAIGASAGLYSKADNTRADSERGHENVHPLLTKSLRYSRDVQEWLLGSPLVSYAETLSEKLNCNLLTEARARIQIEKLQDCRMIIAWYLPFIHSKLARAINANIWADKWAEENGLQKDSDGSAKIALIAIEKSICAWTIVYEMLPECEDAVLNFLALLQHIEKLTKSIFPGALSFVRPGFDDVAVPV